MKTFEQIADLERRYLLGTYNRYPIVLTRGKGVFLYDAGGKRFQSSLRDGVLFLAILARR
jgi:acetylornithine/succinyldiaminopimelate/putrescine aminotransferase